MIVHATIIIIPIPNYNQIDTSFVAMHILLVVATPLESNLIRESCSLDAPEQGVGTATIASHEVSLLHTGIGMVNTSFQLGKYLAIRRPDIAVNVGIAGSFDRNLPLGTVVEVLEDSFAELGAEDNERFIDLEEMGFPNFKYAGKSVFNTLSNPSPSALEIEKVRGITVNRVHGQPQSIDEAIRHWNPQIESMEGAAFFQAMIQENIPFFALRGISNYVEVRNKQNWKIPLAVEKVQQKVVEWLGRL